MAILFAILVVLVAGLLRGMTGFGFALVVAMGFAAIHPPAVTTPTVLLLELAITVLMLRDGGLSAAEPRRLVPMSIGGVAGTGIGAAGALHLPADWVRPALDAAVMVSALVSLAHVHAPALDRPWVAAGISMLVGALAAAFAVGGPFVVVWLLAVGAKPAAIRGNLVVFFGVIDVAAIAIRGATIGIPAEAYSLTALLLVPSLVGVWAGGRLFHRVNAAWWRRIAAWSIVAGALASLARSLLAS